MATFRERLLEALERSANPTFKEAPTRPHGTSVILAAGKEHTFGGAPAPRHRKQIVISNESATETLYVCNTSGEDAATPAASPKAIPIFPETSVTLFTSGPVRIRNASASTITAYAWESFYL